jgi:hypothetical protein
MTPLGVNFIKGWPCPSIVDFVSNNTPSTTTLAEGMIACRNSVGQWVPGGPTTSAINQIPYILWNGAGGLGDQAHPFPTTATASAAQYVQASYGGVQGIALTNQIEVETAVYGGSPQFGDALYADSNGVLQVCAGSAIVGSKIIIGIVTKGVHTKPGAGNPSMITFIPDNSKRST